MDIVENISNWFTILLIYFILVWTIMEFYILHKKLNRNVRVQFYTGFIVLFSLLLTFILSVYAHINSLFLTNEFVKWIGLILIVLGVLLRFIIYNTTQIRFSDNVRFMRSGFNTVIKGMGWYKYTRHPQYISLLLIAWGIGLAFGNYISVIYSLLFVTSSLLLRVYLFEKSRENIYGDSYLRYKRNTKLIFPYLF